MLLKRSTQLTILNKKFIPKNYLQNIPGYTARVGRHSIWTNSVYNPCTSASAQKYLQKQFSQLVS